MPIVEGRIEQVVYVDDRFTVDEYLSLSAAADEWMYTTRGIVHYSFVYPYHVEERQFGKDFGRNVLIKTDSKDPFVIKTDRDLNTANKKKGLTYETYTLGFWHRPDIHSPTWYIGIVSDRIVADKDDRRVDVQFRLKVVTIHELGHALRIDHADKQLGIMNSSASMKTEGCLNRYDAEQFSRLYGIEIDIMNYCR